jgi:CHAD domain-containing protein
MGFRLRSRERVDIGLRRVVREQIRGAVNDLTGQRKDRHEGVHEARKRFKMIRATLRLGRGSLGEESFLAENGWYRDTGRTLSSVRDAVAMIESFDLLRKRFPREDEEGVWAMARRGLEARLARISEGPEGVEGLEARSAGVAVGLSEALLRVRNWPVRDEGFRTIGPGLERVYRQGRECMERALLDPSDVNLHEWRKRVKDHWYHVRLLRNLWPKVMDAYGREMKALSDALGNDHDLAVLAPIMRAEPESFGGVEPVTRLLGLLSRRRTEFQAQARTLGRRIYAEKPRVLVNRFESRW